MCQCYLCGPSRRDHLPSYLQIIVRHSSTLSIPNRSTLATNHERDREISPAEEDGTINIKHNESICACLWKASGISGKRGSINDRVLQEIPYTASQGHPTLRSRFLPKPCHIIFQIGNYHTVRTPTKESGIWNHRIVRRCVDSGITRRWPNRCLIGIFADDQFSTDCCPPALGK